MAVTTWTARHGARRRPVLRAVFVLLIALLAGFESPGGILLPSLLAFGGCSVVSLPQGRRRALWIGVFGFSLCVVLRVMVTSVAGANVS